MKNCILILPDPILNEIVFNLLIENDVSWPDGNKNFSEINPRTKHIFVIQHNLLRYGNLNHYIDNDYNEILRSYSINSNEIYYMNKLDDINRFLSNNNMMKYNINFLKFFNKNIDSIYNMYSKRTRVD